VAGYNWHKLPTSNPLMMMNSSESRMVYLTRSKRFFPKLYPTIGYMPWVMPVCGMFKGLFERQRKHDHSKSPYQVKYRKIHIKTQSAITVTFFAVKHCCVLFFKTNIAMLLE
jgi:hypothetical protein